MRPIDLVSSIFEQLETGTILDVMAESIKRGLPLSRRQVQNALYLKLLPRGYIVALGKIDGAGGGKVNLFKFVQPFPVAASPKSLPTKKSIKFTNEPLQRFLTHQIAPGRRIVMFGAGWKAPAGKK